MFRATVSCMLRVWDVETGMVVERRSTTKITAVVVLYTVPPACCARHIPNPETSTSIYFQPHFLHELLLPVRSHRFHIPSHQYTSSTTLSSSHHLAQSTSLRRPRMGLAKTPRGRQLTACKVAVPTPTQFYEIGRDFLSLPRNILPSTPMTARFR